MVDGRDSRWRYRWSWTSDSQLRIVCSVMKLVGLYRHDCIVYISGLNEPRFSFTHVTLCCLAACVDGVGCCTTTRGQVLHDDSSLQTSATTQSTTSVRSRPSLLVLCRYSYSTNHVKAREWGASALTSPLIPPRNHNNDLHTTCHYRVLCNRYYSDTLLPAGVAGDL